MKFGDTIYYCKKKKEEIEEYEKPKAITLKMNFFSLMPASEYTDVMIYGEDINTRYRAYANFRIWGRTFDIGDKFYIDYAKPIENEEYGKSANAEVTAVMYDNFFVKIEIRKLVQTDGR